MDWLGPTNPQNPPNLLEKNPRWIRWRCSLQSKEDTLSSNNGSSKVTVDQLWTYRFVVTSWTRSIADCCSTDLKPADFENVKDVVLKGDATCSHQGLSFVSIRLVESLSDLNLGPWLDGSLGHFGENRTQHGIRFWSKLHISHLSLQHLSTWTHFNRLDPDQSGLFKQMVHIMMQLAWVNGYCVFFVFSPAIL